MKLTGKKFLLLLLYTPTSRTQYNTPIHGRTRLVKMGFLFKMEILKDFQNDANIECVEFPEFEAWKYGPFSKVLVNDLEFLVAQGYIDVSSGNNPPLPEELYEYKTWYENIDDYDGNEYSEEVFSLAQDKGIEKAKVLWNELTKNQIDILIKFKDKLVNISLERILEYVYNKYKEAGFIEKSLIKERFNL